MLNEDDVRRLAERQSSPRTWLSVYLQPGWEESWFRERIEELERGLEGETERENLEASAEMVLEHLEDHPVRTGGDEPSQGRAVFACWLDDAVESFALRAPVEQRVVLEGSPFVMPLAELLDDWETYVIVHLDHDSARIYEVAGRHIEQAGTASGDIKNHVKKGGWSQQRYERRREKQIHHYCEEIAGQLADLEREVGFDRLFLTGNERLVAQLEEHLSQQLREMVAGTKKVAGGLTPEELRETIEPMFEDEERASERELYETIRDQRFRDGRAATGPEEVLTALQAGRVQVLLLDRTREMEGYRCENCGKRGMGAADRCPACESEVRSVTLLEEMVEMAERTSADVEMADPFDELGNWGGVAALLRY